MEWMNALNTDNNPNGLEDIYLSMGQDQANFLGEIRDFQDASTVNIDNGQGQMAQSAAPVCAHGSNMECSMATHWRQRYEQLVVDYNKRLVVVNNMADDNKRLTKRLADSEKSVQMYQQKLLESYFQMEPQRKELDETKDQLVRELREKTSFQCEAESGKATILQLKALNSKNEEEVKQLRYQVNELKRSHEKTVIVETKLEDAKTKISEKQEEIAVLKKELDKLKRSGFPLAMQTKRRRLLLPDAELRQIAGGGALSVSSDEDGAVDSGSSPAQLEPEAGNGSRLCPPPIPELPSRACTTRTSAASLSAPKCSSSGMTSTKAMAILQRKEMQEADGTYPGSTKRLFCEANRRNTRSSKEQHRDDAKRSSEKVGCQKTTVPAKAPLAKSTQPILPAEQERDQGDECFARISQVLASFGEFLSPPLSPIPDVAVGQTDGDRSVEGLEHASNETLPLPNNVVTGTSQGALEGQTDPDQSNLQLQQQSTEISDIVVERPAPLISPIRTEYKAGVSEETEPKMNHDDSVQLPAPLLSPQREEGPLLIDEGDMSTLDNTENMAPNEDASIQENMPSALSLSPTLSFMESANVEQHQAAEAVTQAGSADHLEQGDFPVKQKRGRPPKLNSGNISVPAKQRRMSISSVQPVAPARVNVDHGILLPAREAQPYLSILGSMFTGAGTKPIEAASKWMKKPKRTSEILAYSFVEAIKRHNSESWIANHLRMVNQASYGESLTRRGLLSRGVAATATVDATANIMQPLSGNDRKLAGLLEILTSDTEEWRNVYELMLMEMKWQLTSSSNLVMYQKEALCRWSFYLCEKLQSEIALQTVKEILFATVRQSGQFEKREEQQLYLGILHVYLSLAMIWPDAFKKIVIDGRCISDHVLQLIFRWTMWKGQSKHIYQRFLKRCLDDASLEFPIEEPNFTFIIREQLHRLSTVALEFNESDSGLRLSPDSMSCVNILLLVAPYCNDKALDMLVESSLTSVLAWNEISTNDAADQGDQKKLIFDILWLSKVTPFYQGGLARRLDELLALLRSIVLDVGSQIGISEQHKFLITYAVAEFFAHLPLGLIPGKADGIRDLLKDMLAIFDQNSDEVNGSIEKACRKLYKDFCSRHELV